MALRISLGALFGLVLALPFGFNDFIQFLSGIIEGKQGTTGAPPDSHALTVQALMLLLPFVLGFSTPLVIMILNRLIDAVQAFFARVATVATNVTESSGSRAQSPTPLSRVAPKPHLGRNKQRQPNEVAIGCSARELGGGQDSIVPTRKTEPRVRLLLVLCRAADDEERGS